MKNDLEAAKLKQFVSDPVMSSAVYDAILSVFLKPKPTRDVHQLAADRIAINLLMDAWRDLERYKNTEKESNSDNQKKYV